MGQQKKQHIPDIENFQLKAIRIMNFKSKYAPSKPLFIDSKIMTFQDIIKSEDCILVLQRISRTLPSNLQNLFKIAEHQNTHHTRNTANQQITLSQVRTTNYGLNSSTYKAAKDWNSVQKSINFNFLHDYLSPKKFIKPFKENVLKKDNQLVSQYLSSRFKGNI